MLRMKVLVSSKYQKVKDLERELAFTHVDISSQRQRL